MPGLRQEAAGAELILINQVSTAMTIKEQVQALLAEYQIAMEANLREWRKCTSFKAEMACGEKFLALGRELNKALERLASDYMLHLEEENQRLRDKTKEQETQIGNRQRKEK